MRHLHVGLAAGLLIMTAAALTATVHAQGGRLEINQACATGDGCFAGDSGGFPVTIDTSGSYGLTGNLTLPDANTGGILIEAGDVTLDLNGFAIQGPVECTSETGETGVTSCSASGTGTADSGVRVFGGDNVTIRNGTIRGTGFAGITCNATECTITKVRAISNASNGISVTNDGVVRDCIAKANGNVGISGGTGVYNDNLARANGDDGFFLNSPDPNGTVVRGNSAVGNGDEGITCDNCSLIGNVLIGNAGFGAVFFDRVAYGQNIIRNNAGGTIANAGNGVQVGGNVCNSDLNCP